MLNINKKKLCIKIICCDYVKGIKILKKFANNFFN